MHGRNDWRWDGACAVIVVLVVGLVLLIDGCGGG